MSIKWCNIWIALRTVFRNHINVSSSCYSFHCLAGAAFPCGVLFPSIWDLAALTARWGGAVDHAHGFFPLPALQHQLYNTLCCHKWCDIFDGAAASAQEAEVIGQRGRKSTGPGVETRGPAPASWRALFPQKLHQVYPELLSYPKWSTDLGINLHFQGLWGLWRKVLNIKAPPSRHGSEVEHQPMN